MLNDIYDLIKEEFEGLDAVYEDAIIELIGIYGLTILIQNKLVESCGVVNGRQLFTICDKPKE